jgi:hypothetical protein
VVHRRFRRGQVTAPRRRNTPAQSTVQPIRSIRLYDSTLCDAASCTARSPSDGARALVRCPMHPNFRQGRSPSG